MSDEVAYILCITFLSILLGVGYYGWNSIQCSRDGHYMQTDSTYKIIGGCYLKQGNVYVPERMYKGVIINGDSQK